MSFSDVVNLLRLLVEVATLALLLIYKAKKQPPLSPKLGYSFVAS